MSGRYARAAAKVRKIAVHNGDFWLPGAQVPPTYDPRPLLRIANDQTTVYWDRIESISITRARSSPTGPPAAAVASIVLRPSALSSLNNLLSGQSLYFTNPLALDLLWATHPENPLPALGSSASTIGVRFSGQITDAGPVTLRPDSDGITTAPSSVTLDPISITATSLYARLSRVPIGRVPWPAGTPDKTIVTDTLTTAWFSDPGMRLNWLFDFAELYPKVTARPASDRQFVVWDVDNQTPDQIFADLIASTGGELVEGRDCRFDWITPEARRATPVLVTLGPEHIVAPVVVAQNSGGLVNYETVTYGPSDAEATVVIQDQASISGGGTLQVPSLGRWPDAVSTRLARADQAAEAGMDIVGRNAYPEWRLDEVSVDILALIEAQPEGPEGYEWTAGPDYTIPAAIVNAEIGNLVELLSLPDYSPAKAGLYWIEGVSEVLTDSSWVVTLKLAAYQYLAPPVRMVDIPAGLAMSDVPDSVSFVRATVWQPTAGPGLAFRQMPTNYRSADAPSGQQLNQI